MHHGKKKERKKSRNVKERREEREGRNTCERREWDGRLAKEDRRGREKGSSHLPLTLSCCGADNAQFHTQKETKSIDKIAPNVLEGGERERGGGGGER
jgi:hypothetical protein